MTPGPHRQASRGDLWGRVTTARRGFDRALPRKARSSLSCAFIGGSVTGGYAASDPASHGLVPRVTRWLRRRHRDTQILDLCAALGGTDSRLGAYRLQRDVFDQIDPDILFIEFAVNDADAHTATLGVEGIVRKALSRPSPPDLCLLYSTRREDLASIDVGELPPIIAAHERIADTYQLPSIWMGFPIAQAVIDGNARWHDFYQDDVHPNDRGFARYSEVVQSALESLLASDPRPHATMPPALPAPLLEPTLESATLVPLTPEHHGPGFTFSPRARNPAGTGWDCFEGLLCSNDTDAELTIAFTGTSVGLRVEASADCGHLLWAVDDSPLQRAEIFDDYCPGLTRPKAVWLVDNLPPGKHRLRLKPDAQVPTGSKGGWLRLGELLVVRGEP